MSELKTQLYDLVFCYQPTCSADSTEFHKVEISFCIEDALENYKRFSKALNLLDDHQMDHEKILSNLEHFLIVKNGLEILFNLKEKFLLGCEDYDDFYDSYWFRGIFIVPVL